MIYCTKCGKQNSDTAKFCTGCGAILTLVPASPGNTAAPSATTSTGKNKITWWVIGIIVVMGLGTGAYFIFFNKKKKVDIAMKNTNPSTDTAIRAQSVNPQSELSSTTPNNVTSYTDMNDRLVYRSDCFVIITGSFADENYARGYVNTMKNEGYNNAGYLWIPDYPSLSGKQFYATFIGPYQSYEECEDNLRILKVNSRFWYGLKVSYEPTRVEIRIK